MAATTPYVSKQRCFFSIIFLLLEAPLSVSICFKRAGLVIWVYSAQYAAFGSRFWASLGAAPTAACLCCALPLGPACMGPQELLFLNHSAKIGSSATATSNTNGSPAADHIEVIGRVYIKVRYIKVFTVHLSFF